MTVHSGEAQDRQLFGKEERAMRRGYRILDRAFTTNNTQGPFR